MDDLKRLVADELRDEFDKVYQSDFKVTKGGNGPDFYTSFEVAITWNASRSIVWGVNSSIVGGVTVTDDSVQVWRHDHWQTNYHVPSSARSLWAEFLLAQPDCLERIMQSLAELLLSYCKHKSEEWVKRSSFTLASRIDELARSIYERNPSLHKKALMAYV
jgi:hypothetical protein